MISGRADSKKFLKLILLFFGALGRGFCTIACNTAWSEMSNPVAQIFDLKPSQ